MNRPMNWVLIFIAWCPVVCKLLRSLAPLVLDDRNIAEVCPSVLMNELCVLNHLSCSCRGCCCEAVRR